MFILCLLHLSWNYDWRIAYKYNLHQIYIKSWIVSGHFWLLSHLKFRFVWCWGIIFVQLFKSKFRLQIVLCCKIRLHCPPAAPAQTSHTSYSTHPDPGLWTWDRLPLGVKRKRIMRSVTISHEPVISKEECCNMKIWLGSGFRLEEREKYDLQNEEDVTCPYSKVD